MSLFRNLLFWLVLALAGALVAQLLVEDPGYVLVRFRGMDYSTTLAMALVIGLAVLAGAWLLWTLASLPFAAVRRRRERLLRQRLAEGMDGVLQGHWLRAEKALAHAAKDPDQAALAHASAARSAHARADAAAVASHLEALGSGHPASAAVLAAELALDDGRPADALAALDVPRAQPLPPRGLALRAQALAAVGRAGEAYGLLGALRQQQALPPAELARREAHWAAHGLREAADANVLADRWDALPVALRSEPGAVAAYAERAAALRWDDAAVKALEHALDDHWDESLAVLYGRLPIGRVEHRVANVEHWLQAHPASPGLLLTWARLQRALGQWARAEDTLHRAIAQGAGAEAWEELGHGFTQARDEARARMAYANALAVARGEAPTELSGRDLQQRIVDAAAIEERDAHGVPRLRGM
ncbi:heme biosynthesis protein HemY [Aerolutibacter ruishenii]|uniref:HemY protein n=1 Tax=Aerolutibacter ruishenii TaxID=686800 RepID=A0A562M0V2_9GAMM|nr:heme biosynthesis HemY N-terminal domain-containing protein [Lysobacter ruishenii]TWI13546.1 HemY protein [Lysobacter ruishenii]